MKSPVSSCSCFFSLHCSHLHPFSIVAFCLACRSFVNATTIHYTTILFPFPPYAAVDLPSPPPYCSTRVQMALFFLLYPVSVRFPAQIGYRRPFSLSCTRFSSDFLLKPGTDHHFPSPVPGFRPISCSNRVQITIFLFLYPFSVVFPVQIGYRSPFSCSCTLAVVLMFSNQHHLRMAALRRCILPPALCNLHSQEKSVSRMSEAMSCCTAHPSFAFPF